MNTSNRLATAPSNFFHLYSSKNSFSKCEEQNPKKKMYYTNHPPKFIPCLYKKEKKNKTEFNR